MIGLLPILTRWRFGLGIAGILAVLGLLMALNFYRHAYHDEKALRASDKAAYEAAQVEAQAKAFALRQAEKAALVAKAERTDRAYQENLADLRAIADAAKLRAKALARASGGAAALGEAGNPGKPQDASGAAFMVSEADIDRCTAWVNFGETAHAWALTIGD